MRRHAPLAYPETARTAYISSQGSCLRLIMATNYYCDIRVGYDIEIPKSKFVQPTIFKHQLIFYGHTNLHIALSCLIMERTE